LHMDLPLPSYERHRTRVLFAFEQLAEVANTISGPKFVFAHIMAPHPPFVFDRYGTNITPPYAYFPGDGSHYQGSPDEYRVGYTEQLLYINTMLEQTITAILDQSPSPPIIIIQADHGPGMLLDFDALEHTNICERFAVLNAYYLPEIDVNILYPEITPVNTFRVIFDTYWGTQLGLLEDRSYYSTWERPYAFEDVTEQVQIQCAR